MDHIHPQASAMSAPSVISTNDANAATHDRSRSLPTLIAAGWGFGTLAPAIVLTTTNIYLLRFMTDFVGIGAALAGGLIAMSKIYDAFTDPAMGVLSDRTKTRIGRRRPYLIAGGVGLAISLILLFDPPAFAASFMPAYMTVVLLLLATFYTIFNVPYLAMPAEMVAGYDQRSTLMSFRVYAVSGAQIVSSVLGAWIIVEFGGGLDGHAAMAWIVAPAILLAALVAFWSTKNAPFVASMRSNDANGSAQITLREQFSAVTDNKPFFVLMAVKLFQLMTLGIYAAYPFFFTQILKVEDSVLGLYFLSLTAGMLLLQPLWLWLGRRTGKRKTYLIALAIGIVVSPTWLLAAEGEAYWLVLLRGSLIGASAGGALLMGQSMLPDTQEFDSLRSGIRREGLLSGVYSTMEKVAQAIGVAAIGAFFGMMGYVESTDGTAAQPQSALDAIYLSVSFLPAIVSLLAFFVLLFFYKLNRTELEALRKSSPFR